MFFQNSGSFGGGALLTVTGSGFDPINSNVTICGAECKVHRETSTSSQLYCWSPFNNSNYNALTTVFLISSISSSV